MDSIIAGISWFVFFFLLHRVACEILVPWPGIKPAPPALEAWGLCHWMAREVQGFLYIFWNSAWHIVGAPQCWLKSSLLSYSAQTVMTEHPRLGRLNKQKLTSPSSGGWKSKIREPLWSDSGENSLLGLQTAAFPIYTHMDFPYCMHVEKERDLLTTTLTLLDKGPTLTTSFNLNHF